MSSCQHLRCLFVHPFHCGGSTVPRPRKDKTRKAKDDLETDPQDKFQTHKDDKRQPEQQPQRSQP